MSIIAKVDLSGHFGPARDQGRRGTCMAFTGSDLTRAFCAETQDMSPEFLYICAGSMAHNWQIGEGLTAEEAMAALRAVGQPYEVDFPYQPSDPVAIAMPTSPPGKAIFTSDLLGHSAAMQGLVDRLNDGHPVGLVIRLTDSFDLPLNGVVSATGLLIPDEYHAVLATGWGQSSSNERYIRIRNSWGAKWGDGGYAWLPEKFVDLHVLEAFGRK